MKKKVMMIFLGIFLCSFLFSISAQYDVQKFGAKGDGKTLDTRSVQSAIDKASGNGGGTVDFEIKAVKHNTNLKIAKVYFRYQDITKTD
jgi:hypothetical protein